MSLENELKGRWKSEYNKYGVVAPLAKHLNNVLDARVRLNNKRAELQANRDLSDQGRAKALQTTAAAEAATIARAGRALRVARGKVAQQRVALTPTVADKTNVAAAFLRMEIRAALRGMDRSQIAALASDSKTDSTTLEAMCEGPAFLTGIDAKSREQILKMVLERTAGPALAVLDEQTEAIDVADAALRAATNTLRESASVGNVPDAFDKWLAKVAPPSEAERAAEQTVYKDSVVVDALSLPASQRAELIDQLLTANTSEFK